MVVEDLKLLDIKDTEGAQKVTDFWLFPAPVMMQVTARNVALQRKAYISFDPCISQNKLAKYMDK